MPIQEREIQLLYTELHRMDDRHTASIRTLSTALEESRERQDERHLENQNRLDKIEKAINQGIGIGWGLRIAVNAAWAVIGAAMAFIIPRLTSK